MTELPFHLPGRFYRGNLHTHTTRSDGLLSPEAVVAAYRQQGYDFIAITDHWTRKNDFPITDSRPYRTADFTTLIGAELHGPGLPENEIWHILAVGLPHDFPHLRDDETGPELAARAAEAGAFVGIAHPTWYGLTPEHVCSVKAAHAVEVFNETCARLNDRGDSWYVTDLLLREGRRLLAYATDDAHFTRPDAFGAWVEVRAERLEPALLLAALKAGHFYSTQGPKLHDITVTHDEVTIACSPASAIHIVGGTWHACTELGTALTVARFPLDQFAGRYCRVIVIDAAGKRAWSNPIWLT